MKISIKLVFYLWNLVDQCVELKLNLKMMANMINTAMMNYTQRDLNIQDLFLYINQMKDSSKDTGELSI